MEFLKNNLKNLSLNKLMVIMGAVASIFVIIFFIWFWKGKNIIIDNEKNSATIKNGLPTSLITGMNCDNANRRPIAVMISADQVARPLSGIGEADITFEMPVTPGGVTRMMAVYQCSEPVGIGSVRSAREAFVPLAAGLNAILAHWGGERGVLDELNSHIIDNVDGMKYETTYFFRKPGIKEPQNGFTDFDKLLKGVADLKYSLKNNFAGYPHKSKNIDRNIANLADSVSINYPAPFDIKWVYDSQDNNYARIRGGQSEIDKNTGSQVKTSVVIIMKTTGGIINKDYNTVSVSGQGDVEIYQNGIKMTGTWKKDASKLDSKLYFYDDSNNEIKFTPGSIWVEITTE